MSYSVDIVARYFRKSYWYQTTRGEES